MAIGIVGGAKEVFLTEGLVLEGMNVGSMYLSSRMKYIVVVVPLVEDKHMVGVGGVGIPLAEQGETERHEVGEDMIGRVVLSDRAIESGQGL